MSDDTRKPGKDHPESATVLGRSLFLRRRALVAREADMRRRQRQASIGNARKRLLDGLLNRDRPRPGPRPVD